MKCSERSNPGDGEETNPLDTGSGTQSETSSSQPEPPAGLESVFGTQLVLVDEGEPRQASQCGEDDQWGVQENQPRLRHEAILKGQQSGAEESSGAPAAHCLEGEVHGGHSEDSQQSRQQTHSHIWHAGFEVVLANVLEVKVAIEARQPAGKGDEQFCKRRVHIHEEAALDVLAGETAKVNLIEDDAGGLVDAEQADEEGQQGDAAEQLPVAALELQDVVVCHAGGGVVGSVGRVRRLVCPALRNVRGDIAANAGDGSRLALSRGRALVGRHIGGGLYGL